MQIKNIDGEVLLTIQANNLKGVMLRGADLKGADLRWADLRGADLAGANLTGADLTGANLRGADLRGADLTESDLIGTNLSGVDLTEVNLRGADLYCAKLSSTTLPNNVIYIEDVRWDTIIMHGYMRIGCQYHAISAWEAFSDEEINNMEEDALVWWRKNKEKVMTAAKSLAVESSETA